MRFQLIRLGKITTIFAVLFVASLFAATNAVYARSYFYPNYDVEIKINPDSTVDVTEHLTYNFEGEYRGVIRQIKLEDSQRDEYCATYGLTCGGFERVALIGVFDQSGRQLDPKEYELYLESNEDTGQRFYTIKWTVWPDGKDHKRENFTWSIKYRLYGSIGWIGTNPAEQVPYLYWNALPENRGGDVKNTKITVKLPDEITFDPNKLSVYSDYNYPYEYSSSKGEFELTSQNLGTYGHFTVAYQLPRESIIQPGKLKYSGLLPLMGAGIRIDGVNLGDIGGELDSMPVGKHSVEVFRDGYASATYEVEVVSGEEVYISSNLQPSLLTWIGIIVSVVLNLAGLLALPVGVGWVYLSWQKRGRDLNAAPSIYPQYHPPEGVQPYMLGSLKDEHVDREDITGSIIDLAYRGYIKIKEIEKGKNYELTRLEGKKGDVGLNEFETSLLDDLFGIQEKVETKELGDTFAISYQQLVVKVYKELVARDYFAERPDKTREKYLAIGIALVVVGGLIGIGLSIVWLIWIGVLGPLMLGFAVAATGVTQMIASNYMPARTDLGSKVLAQVMGFRMYLFHAERYRLQELTPEEFERYLSYAVVFGIEKRWAKSFEGIYKGQPEWYESSSSNAFLDAYWMSNFSRSFSNSLNSTVYQSLPKGGSGLGSGWSGGGGSFGGFSGGGGGGGGSGAF